MLEYNGTVINKSVGKYKFDIGVPVKVLKRDADIILSKSSGIHFKIVEMPTQEESVKSEELVKEYVASKVFSKRKIKNEES